MKVQISYQHCCGHSAYDREFSAEAESQAQAVADAQSAANKAIYGIALPTEFGWANRVHQGDNMIAVMYDF